MKPFPFRNSPDPASHDPSTPPETNATPTNAAEVVPETLDERCQRLWPDQLLPPEVAAVVDELRRSADARSVDLLDLFVGVMQDPFEAMLASIVALRLSPTDVAYAFLARVEQRALPEETRTNTLSPLGPLAEALPDDRASCASMMRELNEWLTLVRFETRAREQYLDVTTSLLAGFDVPAFERRHAAAEWTIACRALRAFTPNARRTTPKH